jgi:predicted DNA-binding transcriptional regulator AlpA
MNHHAAAEKPRAAGLGQNNVAWCRDEVVSFVELRRKVKGVVLV